MASQRPGKFLICSPNAVEDHCLVVWENSRMSKGLYECWENPIGIKKGIPWHPYSCLTCRYPLRVFIHLFLYVLKMINSSKIWVWAKAHHFHCQNSTQDMGSNHENKILIKACTHCLFLTAEWTQSFLECVVGMDFVGRLNWESLDLTQNVPRLRRDLHGSHKHR